MTGQVEGKSVVIAGASSGIGKATASLFAEEGAKVVMLARNKERLDRAAGEIGSNTVPIRTDIGNPDSVRAAFTRVDSEFGRLHALLNVAGAARVRLIEEASDEDIATVVGANFIGPIYTPRSAIPLLKRAGGGDIVNVSSEVTLDDMPLMTLYSATKRGLEGFTKTMTKELKADKIRVTLLVAGSTADTGFADNFGPGDAERGYPLWEKDGYLQRVAGCEPMDQRWVAETMLFVVTRPRGQMVDVIHARSFS